MFQCQRQKNRPFGAIYSLDCPLGAEGFVNSQTRQERNSKESYLHWTVFNSEEANNEAARRQKPTGNDFSQSF